MCDFLYKCGTYHTHIPWALPTTQLGRVVTHWTNLPKPHPRQYPYYLPPTYTLCLMFTLHALRLSYQILHHLQATFPSTFPTLPTQPIPHFNPILPTTSHGGVKPHHTFGKDAQGYPPVYICILSPRWHTQDCSHNVLGNNSCKTFSLS
jgi:hypothetical protein